MNPPAMYPPIPTQPVEPFHGRSAEHIMGPFASRLSKIPQHISHTWSTETRLNHTIPWRYPEPFTEAVTEKNVSNTGKDSIEDIQPNTTDTVLPTTPMTITSDTTAATLPSHPEEPDRTTTNPFPTDPHAFTTIPPIPPNPTQALVLATPALHRLQQDLQILTSFRDNATLHWRPPWFPQGLHAHRFWTLHNPPDVVTERVERGSCISKDKAKGKDKGRKKTKDMGKDTDDNDAEGPDDLVHLHPTYTRRARRPSDPPPLYIKTWSHWHNYCTLYGIPPTFLSPPMLALLALASPTTPSSRTAYPEPQPAATGEMYVLSEQCWDRLPGRFEGIKVPGDSVIVVRAGGEVAVVPAEEVYFERSQWTGYDGFGRRVEDARYTASLTAPIKTQGPGRRWSCIPWTWAQEESCAIVAQEGEIEGEDEMAEKQKDVNGNVRGGAKDKGKLKVKVKGQGRRRKRVGK